LITFERAAAAASRLFLFLCGVKDLISTGAYSKTSRKANRTINSGRRRRKNFLLLDGDAGITKYPRKILLKHTSIPYFLIESNRGRRGCVLRVFYVNYFGPCYAVKPQRQQTENLHFPRKNETAHRPCFMEKLNILIYAEIVSPLRGSPPIPSLDFSPTVNSQLSLKLYKP
jgi:hypothetical protein